MVGDYRIYLAQERGLVVGTTRGLTNECEQAA
jgi:hypothetical protein